MSKVLITMLGAGTPVGQYRPATYKIDDSEYPNSTFVGTVLYKHFSIDKVLFIGTMRSMWDAVYRFFSNEKNYDEIYYEALMTAISEANKDSDLNKDIFIQLENILPKGSKIIPIRYGLNDKELRENMDNILENVEKNLKDGDELYLDVTHSFRHLPMFVMVILLYLRDVSKKQIKVAGIYYGNIDILAAKEVEQAPIVNLSIFDEMIDWIKGANNLANYGNGDEIAQLLRKKGQNQEAELIEDFSDALRLNYLHELYLKRTNLKTLKNQYTSGIESLIIPKVLEDFLQRVNNAQKQSEFQFALSKWHKDKKFYALSYIVLVEALITYVWEKENMTDSSYDGREVAKKMMLKDKKYQAVKDIFTIANKVRRNAAHALNASGVIPTIIHNLEICHSKFEKLT